MTVKALIEQLQQMPPDKRVVFQDDDIWLDVTEVLDATDQVELS